MPVAAQAGQVFCFCQLAPSTDARLTTLGRGPPEARFRENVKSRISKKLAQYTRRQKLGQPPAMILGTTAI